MSAPTEREKRDSRGDEREGQGRKRKRNEREETQEIKIFPSTLTCYKDRGSSNEYPQSMFLSRNKKNNLYPCKPQFYSIKMGFKGVKII